MENFIFYYTLYRNFHLAWTSMQENNDFAKEFLMSAKKICDLEAQTFLTEESKYELNKEQRELQKKIDEAINLNLTHVLLKNNWRVLIGLMCTFEEWCYDTNFFNLNVEKQKFILSENPVDWYFEN